MMLWAKRLLVEKHIVVFSCILAMVAPFVWIIVILHLVSFPTHLLRVRQTTCLTSPGSFSADGPSGPRQEGPRTTGCSPQRCNSCTGIQFYHSQALQRILSIYFYKVISGPQTHPCKLIFGDQSWSSVRSIKWVRSGKSSKYSSSSTLYILYFLYCFVIYILYFLYTYFRSGKSSKYSSSSTFVSVH